MVSISILLYLQTIKKMKKLFLYIIVLFSVINSHAQIHEIGIFTGGINYIGDVGGLYGGECLADEKCSGRAGA
jgi:hypothetical protein